MKNLSNKKSKSFSKILNLILYFKFFQQRRHLKRIFKRKKIILKKKIKTNFLKVLEIILIKNKMK